MRRLYATAATALALVVLPTAAFGAMEWTFKVIDADNNLEPEARRWAGLIFLHRRQTLADAAERFVN